MADFDELRSRAGNLEKALSESDNRQEDLLSGIQANLSEVRNRLVQKKLEYDRLAAENAQLRQIIEQLLRLVESKSKDSYHERLTDLDAQLNVLLALAQDESGEDDAQALDDALAASTVGHSLSGGERPEPDAASGEEAPASLEEIQSRVHKLTEQLQDSAAAPLSAEPAPAASAELEAQAVEENLDEAGLDAVAHSAAPGASSAGGMAQWAAKALGGGPSVARATAPRPAPHKVRKHFDAEVEYALSILYRLKREGQHFSTEEVRDLINGKFNLNLTNGHDKEIAASLAHQPHVSRDARKPSLWQFGKDN